MAKARQQAEWSRVASLVYWMRASVWGREPVKPEKVIPPEYRPVKRERRLTPAERAEESRWGWKVMDEFFQANGRKGKGGAKGGAKGKRG